MDVFDAIYGRRSIRRYSSRPVEEEKVLKCIDAARWAPSAVNSQPWEFIIVRDEATRRRLAEIHRWGRHMAESPVVIIVLADPRKSPTYWQNDTGAAIQNLLLAAYAQGLGTCWIGVYGSRFEDDIKRLLNVPEHLRVVCAITLGYPNECPSSTRRDIKEIVHWEKYGCRR